MSNGNYLPKFRGKLMPSLSGSNSRRRECKCIFIYRVATWASLHLPVCTVVSRVCVCGVPFTMYW